MPTPNSGAASYAAPADMTARYDQRTLGDLCSDDGTRIAPTPLLTNVNLQTALDDAAGMIEAAVLLGIKYTIADLALLATQPLTGQPGNNGRAFLLRLNCDLAIGLLFQRRPDKGKPPEQFDGAMKILAAIEEGSAVFGLLEQQEAGIPSIYDEVPQDVANRNGAAYIASRYFGTRGNMLRRPGGAA